ncbi:MAG: hypothetical protein OEY45_13115, partial [Gammaproteobacteria bacterium]|nr:hypothetical protein [Gammaproteobacteria bacterium]
MTEQYKGRGGAGMDAGGHKSPHDGLRAHAREYNYVLCISGEELAVLEKYREQLIAGTGSFAEIFYN